MNKKFYRSPVLLKPSVPFVRPDGSPVEGVAGYQLVFHSKELAEAFFPASPESFVEEVETAGPEPQQGEKSDVC